MLAIGIDEGKGRFRRASVDILSASAEFSRDPQQAHLEDVLTKEQNTCIEIRDICSTLSLATKDVLHTGFKAEFVGDLKKQFLLLQKRIEVLEMLATRKAGFSNDFVQRASSEWLAKRLSSTSRQRRLRGHKRKAAISSDELREHKLPPLSREAVGNNYSKPPAIRTLYTQPPVPQQQTTPKANTQPMSINSIIN